MSLKLVIHKTNETIHLVEEDLQLGQLLVKQVPYFKPIHDLDQCPKSKLRIIKHHQQEPSNIVHSLAILNLRVIKRVSPQHRQEQLWVHAGHLVLGPRHVQHDHFVDIRDHLSIQIDGLLQLFVVDIHLLDV